MGLVLQRTIGASSKLEIHAHPFLSSTINSLLTCKLVSNEVSKLVSILASPTIKHLPRSELITRATRPWQTEEAGDIQRDLRGSGLSQV